MQWRNPARRIDVARSWQLALSRGGSKPGQRRGGRKPGTPNKLPKGERALVKLDEAERAMRVLVAESTCRRIVWT